MQQSAQSSRKIHEIMAFNVVFIDSQDSIHRAEEILCNAKLSSAPVMSAGRSDCFGIISLADIVRFKASNGNPFASLAWELCSYRPEKARPDDSIEVVGRMMIEHHIHHVIIEEGGVFKGFVSSLDIVSAYVGNEAIG